MLRYVLVSIQLLSCVAIVGLVLLQRGKGAEAGAGFGAGASGTVFGARGASTALSRATAIFAAIFMINSLLLAYVGTHGSGAPARTILDEAALPARLPGGNAAAAPAAGGKTGSAAAGTAAAPAAAPAAPASGAVPQPAAPAAGH